MTTKPILVTGATGSMSAALDARGSRAGPSGLRTERHSHTSLLDPFHILLPNAFDEGRGSCYTGFR